MMIRLVLISLFALSSLSLAGYDDYAILKPDTGDVYEIGDTVTIQIQATLPIPCGLELWFGTNHFNVPKNLGFSGTFDPSLFPIVKFIIPKYFLEVRVDPNTQKQVVDTLRPISDSCMIRLFEYGPSTTFATSGYFTIKQSSATLPRNISGTHPGQHRQNAVSRLTGLQPSSAGLRVTGLSGRESRIPSTNRQRPPAACYIVPPSALETR